MRTWRWYSKVSLSLTLAAFGYWLWPTPWQQYSGQGGTLYRVHRITGRSQYLSQTGWRPEVFIDPELPVGNWYGDGAVHVVVDEAPILTVENQ